VWLADNSVDKQHCCAHNNGRAFLWLRDCCIRNYYWYRQSVCWNPLEWRCGLRIVRVQTCLCVGPWTPFGWKIKFVSGNSERSTWVYTVDGEVIRSSGIEQASDGLYAEVPLWCASGPIARRWIVPTCVWKLSDCKNGSVCWKIATRGPVGRIL
jgi:hypothetical protein